MTNENKIRRGYIDVGERQLHYRYAGDPANPTLLLLHQSPSHSVMYEALMGELADEYYMLAPDNPGFGGSDPLPIEDVSIAAFAAVIEAFLKAMGVGECLAFGHHTGAAIAVQLEHDFPGTFQGMALSGPPLLDEQLRQMLPAMAAPAEADSDGSHLAFAWQRLRLRDADAPLELTEREVISALASSDAWHASYAAVARQDLASQLPAVNCPALVFAGGEDPLRNSVEGTLALLPQGVGADPLAGGRTYLCEQQAVEVATLLRGFFGPLARAMNPEWPVSIGGES